MELFAILGPAGIAVGIALFTSLRVLWEYERAVVFRLGKFTRVKGPGLIFLVPYRVERMERVDLRIVAMDIPPQETITKDNVSVTVNGVVYYRVADPERAVIEIDDYDFAISQLAQTTLRSVIGHSELDEILAERERINEVIREIIDQASDPWGIDVTAVEIKDIDLPKIMKRAMAKQAEAERERRAKVISAEGEYQASRKLADAAGVISRHPEAIQLRFLQTVVEVAAENNSTTLFPIPIDLFRTFVRREGLGGSGGEARAPARDGEEGGSGEDEAAAGSLPSGAGTEVLADVARGLLGLGGEAAGGGERAPVERTGEEEAGGAEERSREEGPEEEG